jgi:hypothetical protein
LIKTKENTPPEAIKVILALRSFDERLKEIMDEIADRRSISSSQKEYCQHLLKELKQDIKGAAKRVTIDGGREPPTEYEQAYYIPALRSASANFRITTNSHPINSNWFSCLYELRIDIGHPLFQLEERFVLK